MTTLRLTYYPDITQGKDERAVRTAVIVFANAVARRLTSQLGIDVEVEVPDVRTVPDQFEEISAGKAQVALMKPVAYVFAHVRNDSIVPACVAHRPIDGKVGTNYFAQLYARDELGVGSLEELADIGPGELTVAYGDRFSTSNFLIPAGVLARVGIHPFLFFRRIIFAGGHDLAAEAVYEGRADIGAGHDGVITILSDTKPDAGERLRRIAREDIHSDPVVVHAGALPDPIRFEDVQSACTVVAKNEQVRSALDLFWGWVKDLSPTAHSNYSSIEDAIAELHLTESDMLR